jgi:hypothetical protein
MQAINAAMAACISYLMQEDSAVIIKICLADDEKKNTNQVIF